MFLITEPFSMTPRIMVSSATLTMAVLSWVEDGEKSLGPRQQPCGAPSVSSEEILPPILTINGPFVKKSRLKVGVETFLVRWS